MQGYGKKGDAALRLLNQEKAFVQKSTFDESKKDMER